MQPRRTDIPRGSDATRTCHRRLIRFLRAHTPAAGRRRRQSKPDTRGAPAPAHGQCPRDGMAEDGGRPCCPAPPCPPATPLPCAAVLSLSRSVRAFYLRSTDGNERLNLLGSCCGPPEARRARTFCRLAPGAGPPVPAAAPAPGAGARSRDGGGERRGRSRREPAPPLPAPPGAFQPSSTRIVFLAPFFFFFDSQENAKIPVNGSFLGWGSAPGGRRGCAGGRGAGAAAFPLPQRRLAAAPRRAPAAPRAPARTRPRVHPQRPPRTRGDRHKPNPRRPHSVQVQSFFIFFLFFFFCILFQTHSTLPRYYMLI